MDGQSIESCSNFEAVQRLKGTGNIVNITFERYLSGPKFVHLQEALGGQHIVQDKSPGSLSVTSLNCVPVESKVSKIL